MTHEHHRYQELYTGIIHVAKLLKIHHDIDIAVTSCGLGIRSNKSYMTPDETITCIHCKGGWTLWQGGSLPVANDEPVEVLWPNGLARVYSRGDHIMWRNISVQRKVYWRKP